ncbi:TonB-dependent siderophore receptor [Paracoccus shanxieyensis]|uniref:TonB-dependent siderophore receptor n=1 Tax=Paracoccus shanxieyensis TaxID=2675752 RepID=A0A6L6IUN5_9RHOB|nr:TonB-dependent siderophore receptor [Paracoccus shanxieyensis]MTH64206.1 TonB-dependent siderophore receptor [Paracoccus shanxieyensis]MTH87350.1 TonB-dependent siderophore receptor [Paracoccus shanxieyensis]
MFSSRVLLLAGASVLTLSLPALAQTEGTTESVVLDEIVLDATAPTQGYVVPTTQIATKTEATVLETQQSVSVVTTQQIRDQGAASVGQALRYSAGAVAEPYGATPGFDEPNIRGFGSNNSQYLNGLRFIRKFGAPSYELYGLERVELLRGPSSGLYGAGSPGGIVNLVQKHAQQDDFAEAGVGYGSFGDASLFFDVNRAPSEILAWRLTGQISKTEEQVKDVTNDRQYLAGAFRWQLDEVSTLDLLLGYQKDSPISPAGVPYALTQIADDDYLREFYAGYPDETDSDRRMFNVGVEYARDLENGWRVEQGFRYQKFDWDYNIFTSNALTADGNFIDLNQTIQNEDSTTLNVDTRLVGDVTTGAATHKILVGLDIIRNKLDNNTQFLYPQDIDWRNPDRDIDVVGDLWYEKHEDLTIQQIGIYAQDEIAWNNWRLSAGLRHSWVKQTGTVTNNFTGTSSAYQKDEATTGRIGLSYLFANDLAPYIAYSTSFDPEIGTDRNGDTLKPTEGKQWEIGVKYQPAQNILLTAAVYDLKQTNVVRSDESFQPFQIGEVHSRGVELEATAELAEGWDVRAAYTYTDARQKGDARETGPFLDGNRAANSPYHMASLWLDRDFGNGFRAGGGVRYVGERYGDDANNYPLDSYTLLDLGASYTRDNIEASLNVLNLADKTYLASCSAFYCNYGEGREVQARLTYKW